MKQIINRKVYDTETAEQIANHGSIADQGDFYALAETLYKNTSGEYFLHCQGGAATRYAEQTNNGTTYGEEIQVLTKKEALDWCEERSINADCIIEEFADMLENDDSISQNWRARNVTSLNHRAVELGRQKLHRWFKHLIFGLNLVDSVTSQQILCHTPRYSEPQSTTGFWHNMN